MILQQKKVRLENDLTTSKNPDSSSVIYITAAKLAKYRIVAENTREKEEKKGNSNEDSCPRVLCSTKAIWRFSEMTRIHVQPIVVSLQRIHVH